MPENEAPNTHPVTETVKASDVRQRFAELVNRVHRGETRVLIEKSGIPAAVLISARDYERFEYLLAERARRSAVFDRIADGFEGVDPDEVEHEARKAVMQTRAERRVEPESGHAGTRRAS